MKRTGFLAALLFISLNVFCGRPVSITKTRLVDTQFGRWLEISTSVGNGGSKTISSIKFSIAFINKMYNSWNYTAPLKIEYTEQKIKIIPGQEVTVKLLVDPPSDSNMVLRNVSIERIIYDDGTFRDLSLIHI